MSGPRHFIPPSSKTSQHQEENISHPQISSSAFYTAMDPNGLPDPNQETPALSPSANKFADSTIKATLSTVAAYSVESVMNGALRNVRGGGVMGAIVMAGAGVIIDKSVELLTQPELTNTPPENQVTNDTQALGKTIAAGGEVLASRFGLSGQLMFKVAANAVQQAAQESAAKTTEQSEFQRDISENNRTLLGQTDQAFFNKSTAEEMLRTTMIQGSANLTDAVSQSPGAPPPSKSVKTVAVLLSTGGAILNQVIVNAADKQKALAESAALAKERSSPLHEQPLTKQQVERKQEVNKKKRQHI